MAIPDDQPCVSFRALVLCVACIKWYFVPEVPMMWVMPVCFFFGVVVPLVRWGLPRPNNRLTHVPIASNADCSAGVPLRAAREKVSDSTQVPTSPVVMANRQPWVAPVVPCKAQACEYPGMLFSTRPVAQVSYHGNMSALEGDAVINSSPAVDFFKPSKQVTSTRSPPKLLPGMAMHKAMQRVYDLPAPKPTTTTAASSSVQKASSSVSSSSASASTSSASPASSASLDELCEALSKFDIYEPDTDIPDAVPGTPEVREIVENEGADTSEQAQVIEDLQDTEMASPSPSPPSLPLALPPQQEPPILDTQAMPPQQQEPAILYTQVMPPPAPIIHPEATPEVVVAAVVAAAPAPAASAIPVASSTGSSSNNNRSRLEIRRPVIRPRSRLRWHRQSGNPPPPLPRPPPSPPRPPPLIPSSPPPQPPTPPASTSSAMKQEDRARPIACPKRRVKRPETTTTTTSSSSLPSSSPVPPSIPPSIPSSSSSTLPSSEAEPAPPSQILSEYAEQAADSFMGGDDILAEIIGTDFDPYDVAVFDEDV